MTRFIAMIMGQPFVRKNKDRRSSSQVFQFSNQSWNLNNCICFPKPLLVYTGVIARLVCPLSACQVSDFCSETRGSSLSLGEVSEVSLQSESQPGSRWMVVIFKISWNIVNLSDGWSWKQPTSENCITVFYLQVEAVEEKISKSRTYNFFAKKCREWFYLSWFKVCCQGVICWDRRHLLSFRI